MLADPVEDSRAIRAGTLILAALLGGCGPNNRRLRTYTGIPMSDVNRTSWHLRRAEIWLPTGEMYCPWAEEDCESVAVTFTVHTLVAMGIVVRDPIRDMYRSRMLGEEYGPSDVNWAQFIASTRRPTKASRRWNIPGRGVLVTAA